MYRKKIKIMMTITIIMTAYAVKEVQCQTNGNSTSTDSTDIGINNNNTKSEIRESFKGTKPEVPSIMMNRRKLDDQSIYLLQRISDRLTALMALDEQQLRRLEALEYRVTRLESQNLDRIEGIRSTVADMGRRMQDMEREFESTKTALDLLHQDAVSLRRGQVQIRREIIKSNGARTKFDTLENDKEGGVVSEPINIDMLNNLKLLTPTVYSILGTISSLQNEIRNLRQNLTQITNMTSYMNSIASNLVTKDYLSIILAEAKQESASPAHTLVLPQQQYFLMASDIPKQKHGGEEMFPEDCSEILLTLSINQTDSQKVKKSGKGTKSGVYIIQPKWSSRPFFVYCDMETRGGGWTVFQKRYEGTVDFFRNWQDYKNGFGNLAGEFWLGLEKLHLLTNFKIYELLVELEDFENEKTYAKFSSFAIGSEAEGYQISLLGDYQGDAGDSFAYHVGMKFSTHDTDKDQWGDGNCAQIHSGAWWYRGCESSNLNGRYLNGYLPSEYENQGIYWQDWHGPQYSLMKTQMAIRPRDIQIHNAKEESKDKKETSEENDD